MNSLAVHCTAAPVVEIDTEANAVYVRFSDASVARTIPLDSDDKFVAMDLDANGSVIGVEVVGAKDFTIGALLKLVPVELQEADLLSRTRYVPARSAAL